MIGLRKPLKKSSAGRSATAVLVVEDEGALRDLLMTLLHDSGLTALAASDGMEALKLYEQEQTGIGLVLADLHMPKMDGRQLLLALKRIDPGVRVIIASGIVDSHTRGELLCAGAIAVLEKPLKPGELLAEIRRVLNLSTST